MLGECLCHRPCQRDCDRFRIWVLASWNHVENHFHCSAYALDCNALHYRYCVWRLTLKIERTHLMPRSSWGRIMWRKNTMRRRRRQVISAPYLGKVRRREAAGLNLITRVANARHNTLSNASAHAVAHRLGNFQCIQYSGSHTIEPRKHQAVNVVEGQSLRGFAPQHVELLSEDKGLGFQRSPRPALWLPTNSYGCYRPRRYRVHRGIPVETPAQSLA